MMTDSPAGSNWVVRTELDTAFVAIDETVYSRAAILRTAYWFTDRAYVLLTKSSDKSLVVRLSPKAPTLEQPVVSAPQELAGEFCNQLLDHQLREDVFQRTHSIRELIVAKALFDAGVSDEPPGDPDDPVAC